MKAALNTGIYYGVWVERTKPQDGHLNGVQLSRRSLQLLTLPISELMTEQRRKGPPPMFSGKYAASQPNPVPEMTYSCAWLYGLQK